jgi:acyl-coenzyme A synthetase/AMP-(fatty) acid ligase
MRKDIIVKGTDVPQRQGALPPNLLDYARTRREFTWETARGWLDGLPGGGLNIAHEAVDRHAASTPDKLALRWLGRHGEVRDLTYGQLSEQSNRFANLLATLGVWPGDRVYGLAARIPELYVAVLGTLKHRAVFCPLFSAFGPEPIKARLNLGEGKVIVTTEHLYKRKVKGLRGEVPSLRHVLLIGEGEAPTAVRMMMKAGTELVRQYPLPRLRFIASVGEPLNPEAVWWGMEAFGLPIHDNWWQTETGGIMIANYAAMDIKPGSMGKPLPGIEAGIVHRDKDGAVTVVDAPDTEGDLALRVGWPSMMRTYLNEQARYDKAFADGWYITGDLAKRDADGYFWFVGRADDVIKSAGHLIGPFEVESALMEHPAVAEAGVIGKPDPIAMEVVKAFVTLKPGHEPSEALKLEIMGHVRKRLGATVAPREIDFKTELPHTRSGKIMRRLLKARELGLPEGDTSTLENE